ncbi:unnamed protein product [Caenorhabditis auriculariae]|uniref:Uncharacterized protein n=1 Tax=Caenorhabditis auriculariae TaxID=2777116 RepID=A0A8S1GUW7_9PELO|nr:unnamed protein product [Caenorhabditis auriculariae]
MHEAFGCSSDPTEQTRLFAQCARPAKPWRMTDRKFLFLAFGTLFSEAVSSFLMHQNTGSGQHISDDAPVSSQLAPSLLSLLNMVFLSCRIFFSQSCL